MIQDHPTFKPPAEDEPLWRYMDLAKFLSMLHTSNLYFARADKMDDPYEAEYPKLHIERWKAFQEQYNRENGHPFPDYSRTGETSADYYLSCWYANRHESAAMWKAYCGQGDGIAICSTMKHLRAALGGAEQPIYAGMVSYIDYDTETFVGLKDANPPFIGNGFITILHKRKSFEHEQEMRLVMWGLTEYMRLHVPKEEHRRFTLDAVDKTKYPAGYSVPVKLSSMVSRVMIAPTARKWFKEVVAASLKAFGYSDIPLEQSSLYDKPVY